MKDLAYRSPKNVTPGAMDEALQRLSVEAFNYQRRHCGKQWASALECMEYYKFMFGTITTVNIPIHEIMHHMFLLGLQTGFDLHSACGDSGPAASYEALEAAAERAEKKQTQDAVRETGPRIPTMRMRPIEREEN